MKKIAVLSLLLIFLTSFAFAGTVDLPKTGQTKCYDTYGNEVPCSGTGQDGEIQAGVAWPSPRFTDHGNGTVTDNLTGLMWTKNANLPNRYKTWQQALDYVAGMNAGNYPNLGYTDWRLPNVNELESLINVNEATPYNWLNSQGFNNVRGDYSYLSSTAYAYNPDFAWVLNMGFGYVNVDGGGYVWPVRAGQENLPDVSYPANIWKTGQTMSYATGDDGDLRKGVAWPNPRFTDNGDTVTDNLTGHMWTKNANLPGGYKTWWEALDYVKGMNSGTYENFDYTDWRLPNRKELYSLTDYSRYNPVLPAVHPFTNVFTNAWGDGYYWSSTTYAYNPEDYAWTVYMWDGHVGAYLKSVSVYVWPVRGPEPTLITLASFTAIPSDRKVILNWTTASEIDNAGFNLYRSEAEDGEYVKINDLLIPADGSPTQCATYQFTDDGVKNRQTYYYKLEDIDLNGTSTTHGPVSVTPRGIYGTSR